MQNAEGEKRLLQLSQDCPLSPALRGEREVSLRNWSLITSRFYWVWGKAR
jgi:hypothetical protein